MRKKNKIIVIKRDFMRRKKFLKIEIKRMILMSIFTNKNASKLVRAKVKLKLDRYSLNRSISRQNNNICLKSGRVGGVFNTFNLSRHIIKKMGINNNLQNYKILGW